MSTASRDSNYVTTLLAVSSVDGVTPVTLYANPTTHRLLVDLAGGGSGTVQTVAVATANGFAGTSDGNASAPTLTLTTSVTGILKGNGTAMSAVTIGSGLSYDGTTLSATGAGSGTVTSVSVTTANGVSGSVATATTTPAITLTLGAITPSSVNVSGLTASEIVITDASKNLTSAAVATYPSLTELTYLKGVTSAIQTQLNAKMTNPMTTGGDIIYGGASGTPTRLANGTDGQVLTSTGTTTPPAWETPATGSSTASAYYFVAADNATTKEKAGADYQCDGTADEVQINQAIDAIRAVGGTVRLSSGSFAIAASINMDGQTAESGDNPEIRLIGSGIDSTFLNSATNIDAIETGQRAKYEMAFFTIAVAGSGDGIHQTAGTERGNWQSHIHDIFIKSNFTDHTGWGIDLQSPFRMRFTNIEMNGVANGCNLQCHTNAFNPGNLSIDRMFIDLWNHASNANAIGLKLAVLDADATGVMNLVTVNRLDIYGGNNLTGSVGISIVGSSTSYGDSRHHTFTNLNIEDIKTCIKHVRGRDCTYNDINYSRVLSGGKFIELDANSHNNHFENAYVVAQGASQTFDLITDANTSANLPNSLSRVDGFQPATVTINATLASTTRLSRIDLSGNSPTIDADITNRNNVAFDQTIELGHATDTTLSRSAAGVVAVEGVVIPSISSTNTLTNKRVTPRVITATSYTTDTGTSLNGDNCDLFSVTAQAGALLFNAPGGTPTNGQKLIITVASSTTAARALTWNVIYEASTVALPTTTAATTAQLNIGFMYSSGRSKWVCIAVA